MTQEHLNVVVNSHHGTNMNTKIWELDWALLAPPHPPPLDFGSVPYRWAKIEKKVDANCNYKSKDYFCQTVSLSLTPDSGSPDGCVCHQVSLTRPYSAKFLLKCENCLDVYKSLDKNRCPRGRDHLLDMCSCKLKWKTDMGTQIQVFQIHVVVQIEGLGRQMQELGPHI